MLCGCMAQEESIANMLKDKYKWVIAAVPGRAWAKKVFPSLNEEEAVEAWNRRANDGCKDHRNGI